MRRSPPLEPGVGAGSPSGAGSGFGSGPEPSIADSGVGASRSGFGSTAGILSVGVFSPDGAGIISVCCDVCVLEGMVVSTFGADEVGAGVSEERGGTVTTDDLPFFSIAWSISNDLVLDGF